MSNYRQRFLLALALCPALAAAPQARSASDPAAGGGTPPLDQSEGSDASLPADAAMPAEEVLVDRPGFILDHSARVRFAQDVLADPSGEGVLVIRGDDLVVDLSGSHLRGAGADALPNSYGGVGIRLEGSRITLTGARVSGFKVAIDARGVDGLTIRGADVSDNFRQRLASTPEREDPADWLQPHHNDQGQWIEKYGAGIHVRGAKGVTIRDCLARKVQNGLILDSVEDSFVFDNDFSFLSGWGIAMWRSSGNLVSRNSLEFCVRGYSHGVYNRGQDSAGLLMFEQCNDNVVALNSITHGGDGIFAFAGAEALGDTPAPEGFSHKGKGCNDNLFLKNDLAYAAAHGLELTFSFRNQILACRFIDNSICGIWAGYSRSTVISNCIFRSNGKLANGQERGAVNIEHGRNNLIQFNKFFQNALGIRLWWDADEHLAQTPWVQANGFECGRTVLYANRHRNDDIGVEIDGCPEVTVQLNTFDRCGIDIKASEGEKPKPENAIISPPTMPDFDQRGERNPIGLRPKLQGRQNIIMTEWGPYDFQSPLVVRGKDTEGADVWRVLGVPEGEEPTFELEALGTVGVTGSLKKARQGHKITVQHGEPNESSNVVAYRLTVHVGSETIIREERTLRTTWAVRAFEYEADPREELEAWRAAAENAVAFESAALDFDPNLGKLAKIHSLSKVEGLGAIGPDRFGLLAETNVALPAGTYNLHTLSDDGIRVLVDGKTVIEDWTHHGTTAHTQELTFEEAGTHQIEVEWFELDGVARLKVELQ